jgi:tRNA pseudouridine55 synthase
MNAVLIIDKPPRLTSHDVVHRVRRILGEKSVGHLGTLDPMATGVLPLVLGSLTRLAQFYTASEKGYEGTIHFGFATDTYDSDGEPLGEVRTAALALDQIQEAAGLFRGVIEQTPPPFSAKKIQGVPAYKLARKKQPVELKPVQVEVKELEILSVKQGVADFRARVASGTYMRAIAHDLGQHLGCGAHLQSLRRTAVGEFEISSAHTLAELESCAAEGTAANLFIHPRKLLPQFPSVTADDAAAARIRSGQSVNLPELSRARLVKVFYGQSELIAIASRVAGTLFHPKIVLVSELREVVRL